MIVQAAQEMLARWQRSYAEGQPVDIAREMAALTLTVTNAGAVWRRPGRVKSNHRRDRQRGTNFSKSPTIPACSRLPANLRQW